MKKIFAVKILALALFVIIDSTTSAIRGIYSSVGNPKALPKQFVLAYILFPMLLCVGGCWSKILSADNPVYPSLKEGEPSSILVLNNKATWESPPFGGDYLILSIDGFSPTDRLYLPKGQTMISLQPGNHLITHFMQGSDEVTPWRYSPMKMNFNTELDKTYVITFERFEEKKRAGYRINYDGWNEEEKAHWVKERLCCGRSD